MELPRYFSDFLTAIRPTPAQKENYKDRHKTLRERLNNDANLARILISDFLQGSYRRATAIRPVGEKRADVDVAELAPLFASLRCRQQPLCATFRAAPRTDCLRNVPAVLSAKPHHHTIRHTTATHLLRAGVDINTIRAWLGHVSLETTNIYAEVDLERKIQALAQCNALQVTSRNRKRWRDDPSLIAFLHAL